jgi:hypothetical protein
MRGTINVHVCGREAKRTPRSGDGHCGGVMSFMEIILLVDPLKWKGEPSTIPACL